MPSILARFKPFARLRERAGSAKSYGARGNAEARSRDTAHVNDSCVTGSMAHAIATTVGPDQQPHSQQSVVAPPINNKACPAPANNAVVDSDANANVAAHLDLTPDDAVTDTVQALANSWYTTPPSPPALPAPPTAACMLEALPAELRIQVFSHISDLRDLRALVLASPVFSQQYCLDRKQILGQVLVRTLGSLMAEAHAVQNAPTLYRWVPRSDSSDMVGEFSDMAKQFIYNYFSRRSVPPEMVLEDCTLADLEDMAAFHQTFVRPLSRQCAALFLHNLDPSLELNSLSGAEQIRLVRALYRFELFCNLLGQGPKARRARMPPVLRPPEMFALLFGPLYPWEVEEIECIYILIRDKYNQVFDIIGQELESPWIPKREDRPAIPPGVYPYERGKCLPNLKNINFIRA